jgi:hypothetical protein
MQALEFYTSFLRDLEIEKQKLQLVLRNYRAVRLGIFLITIIGTYLTFGYQLPFFLVIIGSIVLFLLVLAKYTDCKMALEIVLNKIKLINSEINALQGDFSGFNPGEKYSSNNHPFSGDLDLFKSNGLFAFLNRTTSSLGEKELVSMLLYGNEKPKEVNEIIEKIAKNTSWSLHFRAVGIIQEDSKQKEDRLDQLLEPNFPIKSWFKSVKLLIPILAFSSLILFNLNIISTSFFSLIIILTLIPASIELKNTNFIANQISNVEDRIVVMRNQLISLNELVQKNQNETWISTFFQEKPKEIADELNQLMKIISRYNTRNNMVLGMAINVFLAWDIRQRISLGKWITKNQLKWNVWEQGLAKIEAYISAATIRFNYPNTIYAQLNESEKKEMKGLTHPLLAHTFSVQNDFNLVDSQQFMILTGPNMAGKSTYLRAIGCAIMFANAGFPVFATEYTYPKVHLYTSMRTSDNLSENSSYFFAELSRLRKLMDAVEQNQSVFVLLDEILKGTNSKDKEEGSYKFMEKMQGLGAEGVIATHDLSLCKLETQNKAFFTGHFDSTIKADELTFDYHLKKGVCQNMNASFLLKKMNLVN